jgi:ABC-type Fe3+ transport system permease subunit
MATLLSAGGFVNYDSHSPISFARDKNEWKITSASPYAFMFCDGITLPLYLILIYDVFVNCNWVDTRWQQYSTHLHKNSTWNNTINSFGWKAFWDSNPEWSN